ncbi:PREDICTED: NANOG neighbor homeobox, partial [Propithecus coquereli]|uniref:NANOG neighbor homeobox n=1 Tax=Propithecus coquereli TaxID=379532 RepID=UPI00063F1ABE
MDLNQQGLEDLVIQKQPAMAWDPGPEQSSRNYGKDEGKRKQEWREETGGGEKEEEVEKELEEEQKKEKKKE